MGSAGRAGADNTRPVRSHGPPRPRVLPRDLPCHRSLPESNGRIGGIVEHLSTTSRRSRVSDCLAGPEEGAPASGGRSCFLCPTTGLAAVLAGRVRYDYPVSIRPVPPDTRAELNGDQKDALSRLKRHLDGPLGRERNVTCAPDNPGATAKYLKDTLEVGRLDARVVDSFQVPRDPAMVGQCGNDARLDPDSVQAENVAVSAPAFHAG